MAEEQGWELEERQSTEEVDWGMLLLEERQSALVQTQRAPRRALTHSSSCQECPQLVVVGAFLVLCLLSLGGASSSSSSEAGTGTGRAGDSLTSCGGAGDSSLVGNSSASKVMVPAARRVLK